jgi:hypothetical protein
MAGFFDRTSLGSAWNRVVLNLKAVSWKEVLRTETWLTTGAACVVGAVAGLVKGTSNLLGWVIGFGATGLVASVALGVWAQRQASLPEPQNRQEEPARARSAAGAGG